MILVMSMGDGNENKEEHKDDEDEEKDTLEKLTEEGFKVSRGATNKVGGLKGMLARVKLPPPISPTMRECMCQVRVRSPRSLSMR